MRATEARELTAIAKAEVGMERIYDVIAAAARRGESHVILEPKEMNRHHEVILKREGFEVDESYGDPDPAGEHRRRDHWRISW